MSKIKASTQVYDVITAMEYRSTLADPMDAVANEIRTHPTELLAAMARDGILSTGGNSLGQWWMVAAQPHSHDWYTCHLQDGSWQAICYGCKRAIDLR